MLPRNEDPTIDGDKQKITRTKKVLDTLELPNARYRAQTHGEEDPDSSVFDYASSPGLSSKQV